MATILLGGVDLFFRGKLEAFCPGIASSRPTHDPPDLVIVDIARVERRRSPTVPRRADPRFHEPHRHGRSAAAHTAGFDQVVVKSALVERARELVEELTPSSDRCRSGRRDVHHRRAVHRHQRPFVRRRLPGRLHPRADRILVIDPEECIDCGACEPECPVEAIFPEDALPDKWEPFVKINYAYSDGRRGRTSS